MAAPEWVQLGSRRWRVKAPAWSDWQRSLDRSTGDGVLEPWQLAAECLTSCVRDEEGRPIDASALADGDRDRLLTVALDLLEQESRLLALSAAQVPGGALVSGNGVSLRLRPWSFRERNEALQAALRLQGADVALDLAAYERSMVQACVSGPDGRPPDGDDIAAWPVALGDTVVQTLERLNSPPPDYLATLAACVQTGHEHPDLQLVRLCRAYGFSPADALAIDARLAEQLLAGMDWLQPLASPPAAMVAPVTAVAAEEGVTRIVVSDD